MADRRNEILDAIESISARFNTLDLGDLSTLSSLLRERDAAIASIHLLATGLPRETPLEAASLQRLREAENAGRILAARLRLQIATFREKMASLQHELLLAQALVSPSRETGSRMRCLG